MCAALDEIIVPEQGIASKNLQAFILLNSKQAKKTRVHALGGVMICAIHYVCLL